tara:strand:- start:544 stop:780 length:237 start_codon:yes stop_codon:yes gene_type:complete
MSKYVICLGKKLWQYQDNIQPEDIILGFIECNPKYLDDNLLKFEKSHNEDRGIDCQDWVRYESFDNDELVYVEVNDNE